MHLSPDLLHQFVGAILKQVVRGLVGATHGGGVGHDQPVADSHDSKQRALDGGPVDSVGRAVAVGRVGVRVGAGFAGETGNPA